jgi:Leucine-rich repeat (LRR) protein
MLKGMASLLAKLKPKRRWMQVSLRTVLVLVTLVCVALSMWVAPVERQRRAVAAIQELDGDFSYVKADPASEMFPITFLRRWLPPDYFYEIEYVNLSRSKVTDAGLAHLQGLTSLQGLVLDKTQVTDAGLAHLQGLTSLRGLYLENTQVTDAGLAHLQGLTSLQELYLNNTQVTDAGLAELRKALPNLQIMDGP